MGVVCDTIIMKYMAISTSNWPANWTLDKKRCPQDLAMVNVLCSNILFWESIDVTLSVS